MQFDEYGHSYPVIDVSSCVDCGQCNKVCPMLHKETIGRKDDKLTVYAAYNKDDSIRAKSTSGGVFSVLAEEILSSGGIVYAAKFDEYFHIVHDFIDKIDDIGNFRGSKYAQSNLEGIFHAIKSNIKEKKVLFVGTPCQVEGLKSYIGNENKNLYTCDFICMCISSPKMWESYLNEFHNHDKIKNITFKDKRNSWHNWQMLIKTDKKEILEDGMQNPYFRSYLLHFSNRPSCFSCPYRNIYRRSDFTVADCWGVDKVANDFDDDKGCTTIMLHSEKSMDLFEKIKSKLNYIDYNIENVVLYNPYICKPITKPKLYSYFNKIYSEKGFREASKTIDDRQNANVLARMLYKIKMYVRWI
jgi:coenzyme F420-reducing hydrogenase beta subunit